MSYRIIHAIIYLFSLLPLWWHYIWAYFMYLITYYIVGYRKETVRKNIANSFPELTEKERHVIVKKFYRSFCNHFAEIVKLVSISHRGLEKHIDIRGIDILEKYYNEKRHVILALGHCGNWETAIILPKFMKQEMFAVYRPLENGFIDKLMRDIRSRFNTHMISDKKVARHMLTPRDESLVYYMLADQCPLKVIEKYRIPFLNQSTAMYNGVEKLAQATNAAVVYLSILPGKRAGRYIMDFSLITDTPKETAETEITRTYAARLEENIRQEPYSWLWSHKRWKR